MAFVYRATHQILDTEVALKVMRREYARRESYRKRFLREARTQYRLQHPHIVRVMEFVQDRGLVGCIQEWCNGGPVNPSTYSNETGFPIQELRTNFLPLLDALEQVHQQGFVHRDLKPQNILVQRNDGKTFWKLNDFGLLKDPQAEAQTQTGMIMGTFHYISPEQFEESKHVDKRTDIYSMGVVLYQLLLGRVPFTAKMPKLAVQIMEQSVSFPPSFPQALREVLEKALAKSPQDRYETCVLFKQALQDALGQSNDLQVLPQEDWESSSKQNLPTAYTATTLQFQEQNKVWSMLVKGVLLLAALLFLGVGGIEIWTALQEKVPQWSNSSINKNELFLKMTKPIKQHQIRLSIAKLRKLALHQAQNSNWGKTRYYLRSLCKIKNDCFWYAHWVHHTVKIWEKACAKGHSTSCFWMKKNRKKKLTQADFFRFAKPFYQKACKFGDSRACKLLKRVGVK